jgi:hypothetical protein
MTFASVLPYLEAGRRVRRSAWTPPYQWHATEGGNWLSMEDGTKPHINVRRDLLASDWEVVPEEPAPAKQVCRWGAECGVNGSCGSDKVHELRVLVIDRDATIARLTRELREANDYAVDFKATVERLTRERDGLRGAYDGLRAVAENNADILKKIEAVVKAHS